MLQYQTGTVCYRTGTRVLVLIGGSNSANSTYSYYSIAFCQFSKICRILAILSEFLKFRCHIYPKSTQILDKIRSAEGTDPIFLCIWYWWYWCWFGTGGTGGTGLVLVVLVVLPILIGGTTTADSTTKWW